MFIFVAYYHDCAFSQMFWLLSKLGFSLGHNSVHIASKTENVGTHSKTCDCPDYYEALCKRCLNYICTLAQRKHSKRHFIWTTRSLDRNVSVVLRKKKEEIMQTTTCLNRGTFVFWDLCCLCFSPERALVFLANNTASVSLLLSVRRSCICAFVFIYLTLV